MRTELSRIVHADADALFELAAAVEDWPRMLPHYRWVRVVRVLDGQQRVVEMAARRHVIGRLGMPLWWRSIQTIHRPERRILFEHVDGLTRGMRVEWQITPRAHGTASVVLRHWFEPTWPVPDALVHAIVGEYFVNGVAGRTVALLARKAVDTPAPRATLTLD